MATTPFWKHAARRASVGILGVVGMLVGCQTPTEIAVSIDTDLPCASIRGTTVTVGVLGALENKPPAASTTTCKNGYIGTVVVVPSAAKDAPIALRIVAGVDTPVEACASSGDKGCIVARRALAFLPHNSLRLPISLREVCVGNPCDPNTTCVSGSCQSAVIVDPAKCQGSGCDEASAFPKTGHAGAAGAGGKGGAGGTGGAVEQGGRDGGSDHAGASGSAGMAGAPGLTVSRIAVGGQTACVLGSDRAVRCFGQDVRGQFGDGTTAGQRALTRAMPRIDDAVDVAVGQHNVCVLRASGSVVCAGANTVGQLGDGTTNDAMSPVAVAGLSDAVSIAVSGNDVVDNEHACALRKTGEVECWGSNTFGQVGGGMFSGAHPPASVVLPLPAVAIATGHAHSCAALDDGSLWCWGISHVGAQNADPIYGFPLDADGAQTFPLDAFARGSPTPVTGVTSAISVSAARYQTCFAGSDGVFACMGANVAGLLGPGAPADTAQPFVIANQGTLAQVSAGYNDTCVRRTSGTITCWGRNEAGELGIGASAGPDVIGINDATSLSVGFLSTCAIRATGGVACWGRNNNGEVTGTGVASMFESTPVALPPLGP